MTSAEQAADAGSVSVDGLMALESAVLAVDGVAALHGGAYGTVASYLPGRRVTGLRLDNAEAHVHLALYEGSDLSAVAEDVRAVVAGLTGRDSRNVVITIEDLLPRPLFAPASAPDPIPLHTSDQEKS